MCRTRRTVSRFRALIAPLTIVAACALFAWLIVASGGERAAEATPPGSNGKIAFEQSTFPGDILVINPDGSGIVNLTNSPEHEAAPAWSPDGQRIAFSRDVGFGTGGLWVMDADGSNQTQLTDSGHEPAWHPNCTKIAFLDIRDQGDANYVLDLMTNEVSFLVPGGFTAVGPGPEWSPDGMKLAYGDFGGIFVANSDGTEPAHLILGAGPSWSPNSTKIAYRTFHVGLVKGEIFAIEPDGSNNTNLTNSDHDEGSLSWSPDGARIVYDVDDVQLWMMNADGTDQTQFTQGPSGVRNPDWQPLVEDRGCAAFELATPAPSITPTSGQVPSGLPSGGGNPDNGSTNLPLLVAGADLLVISFVTWYARRRWMA